MRKSGSQPGDVLILTKPLGTGTLLAAAMRAKARGVWITEALRVMQQSNGAAASILMDHEATAGTDVTGFGLIGHLGEMLRASNLDADVRLDALPSLPGAVETLAAGISSSLAPANLRLRRVIENLDAASAHPAFALLFDPQTAGGLLATVPPAHAIACIRELHQLGYGQATVIGEIREMRTSKPVITLLTAPRQQAPDRIDAGAV
jgi:selenide,water dikinase